MTKFITNAEKVNRSITLTSPEVMDAETLADLVAKVTEDFCLNKTKGQMIIMLRSMIRSQLEALDLNAMDLTVLEALEPDPEKRTLVMIQKLVKKGELKPAFINSDKDIIKAWDVKWIPELRVQKSAEEKALEAWQGLDAEAQAAVMAKYEAGQKK